MSKTVNAIDSCPFYRETGFYTEIGEFGTDEAEPGEEEEKEQEKEAE